MPIYGPVEKRRDEILDGVHDLAISVEIYRITKAIEETRIAAEKCFEQCDPSRPFSDRHFMEGFSLDTQVEEMEKYRLELLNKIRKTISA